MSFRLMHIVKGGGYGFFKTKPAPGRGRVINNYRQEPELLPSPATNIQKLSKFHFKHDILQQSQDYLYEREVLTSHKYSLSMHSRGSFWVHYYTFFAIFVPSLGSGPFTFVSPNNFLFFCNILHSIAHCLRVS